MMDECGSNLYHKDPLLLGDSTKRAGSEAPGLEERILNAPEVVAAIQVPVGCRHPLGGRMKHISAVLVAVLACGACTPTDSSQSELAAFRDGAWTLVVDRTLRGGGATVRFPADPLSESDFAPATGNSTYRVDVSEQGARIVVTEPRLVGRLESATPDSRTYQIVEGSFTGGRFVASQVSGGLQGELTMYGSGVPVVRSERGPLRQVR
jgi:hypothetical protein